MTARSQKSNALHDGEIVLITLANGSLGQQLVSQEMDRRASKFTQRPITPGNGQVATPFLRSTFLEQTMCVGRRRQLQIYAVSKAANVVRVLRSLWRRNLLNRNPTGGNDRHPNVNSYAISKTGLRTSF